MKRFPIESVILTGLCATALAIAVGLVWHFYFSEVTIRIALSSNKEIKGMRAVLLQGPHVQMLSELGLIRPNEQRQFEKGKYTEQLQLKKDEQVLSENGEPLQFEKEKYTAQYVDADSAGTALIEQARRVESVIVGFVEFADGRICRTKQTFLSPKSNNDVILETSLQECWRREGTSPSSTETTSSH